MVDERCIVDVPRPGQSFDDLDEISATFVPLKRFDGEVGEEQGDNELADGHVAFDWLRFMCLSISESTSVPIDGRFLLLSSRLTATTTMLELPETDNPLVVAVFSRNALSHRHSKQMLKVGSGACASVSYNLLIGGIPTGGRR